MILYFSIIYNTTVGEHTEIIKHKLNNLQVMYQKQFILIPMFSGGKNGQITFCSLAMFQECPGPNQDRSLVFFSHEWTKEGRKSPRGLARLTNVAWLLIAVKIWPVLMLAGGGARNSWACTGYKRAGDTTEAPVCLHKQTSAVLSNRLTRRKLYPY